jgi:uncharacterized protein YjbI with pentapeptide repeats
LKRIENERLEGCSFKGQDMAGGVIAESTFIDCDFSEVSLAKASLLDVSFIECNLSNLKLIDSRLNGVRFKDSKIAGVDFSPIVNLLTNISFEECKLLYCAFEGLKLKRLQLNRCQIVGCQFEDCDLTEANFCDSNFAESSFAGCLLKRCDFRGAEGYQIDIRHNDLAGARFSAPEVLSLIKLLGIVVEY